MDDIYKQISVRNYFLTYLIYVESNRFIPIGLEFLGKSPYFVRDAH
jgi:hypothetical protein